MNKILVPIDFSKQSEYALRVAAKIAEKTNYELHLLHMLELPSDIIDPTNNGSNNSPIALLYMKRAQEKFQSLIDLPFLKNVNIIKSVFFHKTFDGIINESKKHQIDLIVMGSKGVSGFSEILIGSNTEKVVRHSEIPVLVIKNKVENFKMKDIVFASTFDDIYKSSFKKAVEFSKKMNAKVHLLRVITPSHFENSSTVKEKMSNFIEDSGLKDYTLNLYNDHSVEKGILNFGKEINADTIALSTHGKRGVFHLFENSVSSGLANHAIRPIMTFKI